MSEYTVDVWTLPDCHRCGAVIATLRWMGYTVAAHSARLEDLSDDDMRDDVLAALSLQDGVAPVVYSGGRFLSSVEVDELIGRRVPARNCGNSCRI